MSGTANLFDEATPATAKDGYVSKGAIISGCGQYRYLLWREWRGAASEKNWRWIGGVDGAGQRLGEPKACVFVMLNPSTADGETDDPTIRRCVAFAKRLGFDRLEVVNLYAFRATDPNVILKMTGDADPIGPSNQQYVESAAHEAGAIICAWGAHGKHIGHDETVLGWLGDCETYALGLTKDGSPRHPLYLRADAPLVRFAA